MNKLFANPYIKETVNQNRLTSPMSTGLTPRSLKSVDIISSTEYFF